MNKETIPEGWKKIKLKEVLTEISERNKGEKVSRVLSVTNSQGFVNQEDYFEGIVHSENISNYKIIRKNQFAYNPSRVNVGSIDILKEYDEGALSPMYVIFETDNNRLLPEYFKYYFQTHRFFENVKNNTQGSVRNSLSFKALADFDYLLPPIEEQAKIIKIIENIENIINLDNEKINFIEKNRIKILNNFFEEKQNFNVCKLEDISIIKGRVGWKGYTKADLRKNGPLVLGAGQINDYDEIDLRTPVYISREKFEESPEIKIKIGDIILSQRGSLGKIGIIDKDIGEATINPSMVLIKDSTINSKYLYYYLCSYNIKSYIKKISSSTSIQMISQQQIGGFEILIPKDKSNVEIFVKTMERFVKYRNLIGKELENYKDMKKALMQKLLTGKVRVKI